MSAAGDATMRHMVYHGVRDIRLAESEIPVPGPGEVVIKNAVTLTCGTDVKMYLRGYRFDPPHGIGHEAAGTVFSVGEGVEEFVVGDRIVAHNTAPCQRCEFCKRGLHSLCPDIVNNLGAYGEYWRIPVEILRQNAFHLPDDMSFTQAALTEPLSCAVYGVSQLPIGFGDVVAVNGCGPIGLMFVRLATLRGARVVAVDPSAGRLAVAERLGAWHTVLPEDLEHQVSAVRELTSGGLGVDVAIEATGVPAVWNAAYDMARPGATVLLFGGTKSGTSVTFDCHSLHYDQITVKGVYHTTPQHVAEAFELLRMGVISAEDFVQNEYPLERTEEALLEHANGAVIKNAVVYE